MPNRGDRGGAETRARIAAVATELFLAHGFDAVTTAEVAAAAGVSKVTLFKYFERKEDLLLDRLPDAVDHIRASVEGRPEDQTVVVAVRILVRALAEQRHPLSGLSERADPFIRTVVSSPALIARLREFGQEVEGLLVQELADDPLTVDDAALTAALIVAAYRTVVVATFARRAAGWPLDEVASRQLAEIERAFDVLEHGVHHRPPGPIKARSGPGRKSRRSATRCRHLA